MPAKVLMMSARVMGSHSLPMRSRCSMIPTPAGMKSNDKCRNKAAVLARMFLSSFSPLASRVSSSKTMPITGPGMDKASPDDTSSPTV